MANAVIMGYSSGITTYGATVFFNPVSSALNISRTVTSIAIAMTRAESTVLALLIGYLVDRFGPRGPIIFGMTLMGSGLILFGLYANSLLLFVLTWTFMVAMGTAIGGFAPNWATINNWFVRKKGRAMGIGMASQSMGGVILAPILAFIIFQWGWQTAAVVAGIGVVVLVLPMITIIRTRPSDVGLQPDGDPEEDALAPPLNPFGIEAPGPVASSRMTATVNFSIRQATKTPALWTLMGAYGLRQMGQGGIMLHLSPLLQDLFDFSPLQAGGLVGAMAFMGVIGAIVAGLIGDHYPKRRVMATIVGIEAVALSMLLLGSTGLVYLFIVAYGFGQGAHALNRAILGEYFGNSHYARLWGMIGMASTPLAVAGPIYAGWLSESQGYGGVIFTFLFLYAASSVLYLNCRRPSLPQTQKMADRKTPQ